MGNHIETKGCRFALVALLAASLIPATSRSARSQTAAQPPDSSGSTFRSLEVAPVWAGHPVGFAIETTEAWQYVAFYDPERRMTVAQRRLDSSDWTFERLPSKLGWDSHNYVTLAVDAAGFVHVSGNMHGDPLVYFRSVAPHDISEFEQPGMVGSLEERITYPRFFHGHGGELFFQYRNGKSGDAVQLVNAYDAVAGRWRRLLDRPLFDGGGAESAYPVGPTKGPDGFFHLVWMWRETPSGATNHDLSYARSRDLLRWETAAGEPLALPIRPGNERAVVDPVAPGGGLAGIAFGVGFDSRRRPIVTYSKYDAAGASQSYNARWTGGEWRLSRPSDWTYRWDLDRTGTLGEAIVVRPPTVDRKGRLVQTFRHVEAGAGVWVLDEETLTPVEVLPLRDDLARLKQPESRARGMEVRELIRDRQGRYFLRWETLGINRDRPRKPPYPEPSMLRVYWRAEHTEEELDDSAPPSESAEVSAKESSSVPDAATLEARAARIGEISIQIGNVFDESDPTEDKKLFRLVNRLRRKTRKRVVRRDLLFESGDPFSRRVLDETERLLRSKSYLFDAQIVPVEYRPEQDGKEGEVDLVVKTRDVWTLSGGASFSRSGGENSTRFHVEDTNFLGTGKELAVSRQSDVDRSRSEFKYRDFNLLGSRAQLELRLQENSDGYRRLVKLRRPFYALDTRRSMGLTLLTEERIDPLFDRGEVVSEFGHRIEQFSADWGFSKGLQDGFARRWSVGFSFLRDQFEQSGDRSPMEELPADRTLSYPWVGFDLVEDRFIEAVDLDKIARVEDLNLGSEISARVGWSSPAFGGDRDEALIGISASTGFHLGDGRLLLLAGEGGTRWSSEGFANAALSGSARYYRRNFGRHGFFAEFEAAAVENLDAEQQLLIGGDSGLRGYPLRFQSGDRRLLLSLEQRFYWKGELFKLARVGAAFFFDAGRAWFAGAPNEGTLGVLKDVGFGLRFVPTRSSGKAVFHVDVAFPLDAGGSIDSVQYLFTTKETL